MAKTRQEILNLVTVYNNYRRNNIVKSYLKITCFLMALCFCGNLNIANATIYYSIATGSWDDATVWSTTGFGGGPAVSFPVAGDTAYIKSYDISVDRANAACAYIKMFGSGTDDAKLHPRDTYTLTVSGDMLLDADGGSEKVHLHLGKGSNGGNLTVQGDFF